MPSLLERNAQAALVFGTRPRFAAGFDLTTIGDVTFQEAVGLLIIDLANVIVAELTNFAARSSLAASTRTLTSWAG
jgi:hypothetical protein